MNCKAPYSRSSWLVATMICLGLFATSASAGQQTLLIPSPGWHFLSLQVIPYDASPSAVFPVGGGFAYDHLWAFDPEDGWRHFSPDPFQPAILNDLKRIEGLKGYWIHVTKVPQGGATITVEGGEPTVQQMRGRGWHAVGAFVPPDSETTSVEEVFESLGPALPERVYEVSKFDPVAQGFEVVWCAGASQVDPSADCVATAEVDCAERPELCLAPGEGLWVSAAASVVLGQDLKVSTDCLTIESTSANPRLDIDYSAGTTEFRGRIIAEYRRSQDSGLFFRPSKTRLIDEVPIPALDTSSSDATGPDPASCLTDLCDGEDDCVNVCFSQPDDTPHTVYTTLQLSKLTSLDEFSECVEGSEFATLRFERKACAAGDAELLEADCASDSDCGTGGLCSFTAVKDDGVPIEVMVAVRPPVLRGGWGGSFVYGDAIVSEGRATRGLGEVPLVMQIEDADAGRVRAVINPIVIGSNLNGLDDDGDGEVDEDDEGVDDNGDGEVDASEGSQVPRRDTPAYAPQTELFGEISENGRQLRLRGSTAIGGNGISRGIGALLEGSTREITFDGYRTAPETFVGTFTERYVSESLGPDSEFDFTSSGRFSITRLSQPHCVARDPGALRSLPLGILCSTDDNCPRRCVGLPGSEAVNGQRCTEDADCSLEDSDGAPLSGQCLPFPCRFTQLGGAEPAVASSTVLVSGLPVDDRFIVDVDGPDGAVVAGDGGGDGNGSVDLPRLPCGEYEVRIWSESCTPIFVSFNPCETDTLPVSASDCEATIDGGTALVKGGIALTGASSLQGDSIRLTAIGGQPILAGPGLASDWTDRFSWSGTDVRNGVLRLE